MGFLGSFLASKIDSFLETAGGFPYNLQVLRMKSLILPLQNGSYFSLAHLGFLSVLIVLAKAF